MLNILHHILSIYLFFAFRCIIIVLLRHQYKLLSPISKIVNDNKLPTVPYNTERLVSKASTSASRADPSRDAKCPVFQTFMTIQFDLNHTEAILQLIRR